MFFVNSMSDLFHEDITFDYIDKILEVINETKRHTYQILTKRSKRMKSYFSSRSLPANVWLGVTVENKKHGVPRINDLKDIEASIRFISCEPLLENLGNIDLTNIHWVIAGGESGSKARLMHEDWVISLKNQCEHFGSALFFQAMGYVGDRRNKKK